MLSAIIPTYNEAGNISLLLRLLSEAFKGTGIDYEIIVVDDNSQDGTALEIRKLTAKSPRIRLIERKGKLGLTSAIVTGAKAAKGDSLIIMDADLSHPPEAVVILAKKLETNDLVIASRLMKGGKVENWPTHRKIISKGADTLSRIFISTKVTDPMSGFFAIKKEFFEKTKFRTKGYKLLLNILADNKNIRIAEIPYTFKDRHSGKTKLGNLEIITYVGDLMRIRFG